MRYSGCWWKRRWLNLTLVGGLEHLFFVPSIRKNHHPKWLSSIFQRGGEKPPTSTGKNRMIVNSMMESPTGKHQHVMGILFLKNGISLIELKERWALLLRWSRPRTMTTQLFEGQLLGKDLTLPLFSWDLTAWDQKMGTSCFLGVNLETGLSYFQLKSG